MARENGLEKCMTRKELKKIYLEKWNTSFPKMQNAALLWKIQAWGRVAIMVFCCQRKEVRRNEERTSGIPFHPYDRGGSHGSSWRGQKYSLPDYQAVEYRTGKDGKAHLSWKGEPSILRGTL